MCYFKILSKVNNAPVFIYLTSEGMPNGGENLLKRLNENGIYISLVEVMVEDWYRDFSPWEAEPLKEGDTPFAGKGEETLKYIEKVVMQSIEKDIPNNKGVFLVGYSLAGLFSLWALTKSSRMGGAVCCSSSLWFPGWNEYIENNCLKKAGLVYLSLGEKESKTKNKFMSKVEENTRKTYLKLLNDENCLKSIFEMVPGGHFTNPLERIGDGIEWMLKNMNQ